MSSVTCRAGTFVERGGKMKSGSAATATTMVPPAGSFATRDFSPHADAKTASITHARVFRLKREPMSIGGMAARIFPHHLAPFRSRVEASLFGSHRRHGRRRVGRIEVVEGNRR